jgi:anti-sigma B factor antagonist
VRELVKPPLGRDPALLLKQEGASMFSVNLSTRECDGHVVVALGGELDLVDAADVAAALVTVAAREPEIIVDLAGLEFIDSSGVAALARGRKPARHAGSDLLLAAPRQPVLRVLAVIRLIDDFSVHASVAEAAERAGRSRRAAAPAAGRSARVA